MKRIARLLAVAGWAGLVASSALAAPPAELAARIQARYRTIDSLAADYDRESRFVAAGAADRREVAGGGRLYWARPDRLRMEQALPREELVVADGQEVWWVRPALKRAEHYPAEAFTGGLRPLLDVLGGLARLDESFDLLEAGPEETPQGLAALALAPRQARADLKRLVVWVDPASLVLNGFRIVSMLGDVTEYRLREVRVNPELPAERFRFAPPEGYRMIEQRLPR